MEGRLFPALDSMSPGGVVYAMNSPRIPHSLIALAFALLLAGMAWAGTQDIVHMDDGRVLHGQIIKETDNAIVFDYLNPDLGISVTMTLPKSKILRVERDVETGETSTTPGQPSGDDDRDEASGSAGTSGDEASTPSGQVTSFYSIPLHGDVGTDITHTIYDDIIDEINTLRPDVVIYEIDSGKSISHDMLSWWMGQQVSDEGNWWESDPTDRQEHIFYLVSEMEKIVLMFQHKVPSNVRQVVWMKNATGPAAILAMSWEEMYMHPDASFGTLGQLWAGTLFEDADVRKKMQGASFGAVKALTQFGRHDDAFVMGLLDPTLPLSFSCRGREAIWYNHSLGDIPVSATQQESFGDEFTNRRDPRSGLPVGLEFSARPCEEFLISDGTAETLQDLAMLMGYREYKVEETEALIGVAEYREKWRAMLKRAYEAFEDYQKYMSRGTLSDLQKAKTALTRIIGMVRTNASVAMRVRTLTGADLTQLEIMLENLKAQIRQMARGGGGGGGAGGGGRGGGGGPQRP